MNTQAGLRAGMGCGVATRYPLELPSSGRLSGSVQLNRRAKESTSPIARLKKGKAAWEGVVLPNSARRELVFGPLLAFQTSFSPMSSKLDRTRKVANFLPCCAESREVLFYKRRQRPRFIENTQEPTSVKADCR
jgi:hypothetical protein